MGLTAGTVTVVEDGTRTGSGLSLAIYDSVIATPGMAGFLDNTTIDPETGLPQVPASAKLSLKRGNAELSQAIASAVIAYFVSNTVLAGNAHVTSQSVGRIPDNPVAGTPIDAPAAPVDVPLSGGIS